MQTSTRDWADPREQQWGSRETRMLQERWSIWQAEHDTTPPACGWVDEQVRDIREQERVMRAEPSLTGNLHREHMREATDRVSAELTRRAAGYRALHDGQQPPSDWYSAQFTEVYLPEREGFEHHMRRALAARATAATHEPEPRAAGVFLLGGPGLAGGREVSVDEAAERVARPEDLPTVQATPASRRPDHLPETAADTRFFDLRESGFTGPIRDGYAVTDPDTLAIFDALDRCSQRQMAAHRPAGDEF